MKSPQDMRIIQIDITNACMYQCSNCTRFCGHHKKNFYMDFETFKRAVQSLKGYHGTIGMMGGEPTLHPQFEMFAEYLNSQMTGEYEKQNSTLIRPQKDFIEAIKKENEDESEVYHYHTGDRDTNVGAGLWSAMVPSYKKNYEIIQDTFKIQAVNDHGNVMYHSPILINRKDLGIPDDKWLKIRDNCWAQRTWSATITPKGAFFCEIAGALDMLFDGPGGWPIEEGWWKRTPDQFGEQLRWCEYCGIAIDTFTRNANDWVDDVSETMYEKLKEVGSPKIEQHPERINLVKIENGKIDEKSKKGAKEIRHELFYDNFESRFNKHKSILYPDGFDLIVDVKQTRLSDVTSWLDKYRKLFKNIFICSASDSLENLKIQYNLNVKEDMGIWGHSFASSLKHCEELRPVVYMDRLLEINKNKFPTLGELVYNPGTLLVSHLDREKSDYLVDEHKGIFALLFNNARSLRKIGFDGVTNADSFISIENKWEQSKVVHFDSSMVEDYSVNRLQSGVRYAVYGAGVSGGSAIRDIRNIGSEIIIICDSDSNKWGNNIDGIEIVSPQNLWIRRDDFDKIVIASSFFMQIKETLEELGFDKDDYIIH